MGRGLSPLQKDILAVLEEFPAREDFPEEGTLSLSSWAHPQQILQRLKRPPTASNRTAVSKALARLVERGMVAAARGELYAAGKSFFYVRITGCQARRSPVERDFEDHRSGPNANWDAVQAARPT
jgi:hypothetical protein